MLLDVLVLDADLPTTKLVRLCSDFIEGRQVTDWGKQLLKDAIKDDQVMTQADLDRLWEGRGGGEDVDVGGRWQLGSPRDKFHLDVDDVEEAKRERRRNRFKQDLEALEDDSGKQRKRSEMDAQKRLSGSDFDRKEREFTLKEEQGDEKWREKSGVEDDRDLKRRKTDRGRELEKRMGIKKKKKKKKKTEEHTAEHQ